MKDKDSFQLRRETDPQSLIDDLLGQTSRQAKSIHNLNAELEGLRNPSKKDRLLLLNSDEVKSLQHILKKQHGEIVDQLKEKLE